MERDEKQLLKAYFLNTSVTVKKCPNIKDDARLKAIYEKVNKILELSNVSNHKTFYLNSLQGIGNKLLEPPVGLLQYEKCVDLIKDAYKIEQINNSGWPLNIRCTRITKLLSKRSFAQRNCLFNLGFLLVKKMFVCEPLCPSFEQHALNCFFNVEAELDAYLLKSTREIFIDRFDVFCEILCTRSFSQLKAIMECYKTMFNENLQDVIIKFVDEDTRKLFLSLLTTKRNSNIEFKDEDTFFRDFDPFTIFDSHNENIEKLIQIFSTRSYYEICQICKKFQEAMSIPLNDYIEFSPSNKFFLKCIKTICEYSMNPYSYFARNLTEFVLKKDFMSILRIIVTRVDIDMKNILEAYMCIDPKLTEIENAFKAHHKWFKKIMEPILLQTGINEEEPGEEMNDIF